MIARKVALSLLYKKGTSLAPVAGGGGGRYAKWAWAYYPGMWFISCAIVNEKETVTIFLAGLYDMDHRYLRLLFLLH